MINKNIVSSFLWSIIQTKGMYDSVKYLCNLPQVDRSRIGISGHSIGGYTTAVTLASYAYIVVA